MTALCPHHHPLPRPARPVGTLVTARAWPDARSAAAGAVRWRVCVSTPRLVDGPEQSYLRWLLTLAQGVDCSGAGSGVPQTASRSTSTFDDLRAVD